MLAVVKGVVMQQRAGRSLQVTLIWTVAMAAFGAVLLGSAGPAAACSCGAFTDEQAIENAAAVFTGTLAEIVTPEGDTYNSSDPERFVFDVDKVFKGKVFARQSIVTAREGASCGLEISGSGPFVVFAVAQSDGITKGAVEGELYSGLCTGTRALSSGALPASFREASSPISGSSAVGGGGAAGESGADRPIALIAAIAVALALFGATFAYRRRTLSPR